MSAQTFVLVGPNAGKSGVWGGYAFVDGQTEVKGSLEDLAKVQYSLSSYYSAWPIELAAAKQAEYDAAQQGLTIAPKAPAPQGSEQTQAPQQQTEQTEQTQAPAPEQTQASQEQTQAPRGNEQTQGSGSTTDFDKELDLAAAIGKLDPENDEHWTSNNLPALDHLASVLTFKPSRAEVEAAASGYTRQAARAAKATQ